MVLLVQCNRSGMSRDPCPIREKAGNGVFGKGMMPEALVSATVTWRPSVSYD